MQPDGGRRGAIAQLVERVLCKHEVVGSIPSGSTIHFVHDVARRHYDLFVLGSDDPAGKRVRLHFASAAPRKSER